MMGLHLFIFGALVCWQSVAAFSPLHPLTLVQTPKESDGAQERSFRLRRPHVVKMVAGGAERAYQEEYYDGKHRACWRTSTP